MIWRKTAFFLLIIFCLTPYGLPPLAFAAGLLFASFFENPYAETTQKYGTILFTISVILFGFGLNFRYFQISLQLTYVLLIAAVFSIILAGLLIVKLLKIKRKTYSLITAAVAVGGKDTIAAISPAINVEEKDLNTAFSTIFLINMAAVFVFPVAAYFLNLKANEYAVWTALAIPDTLFALSSAAVFGTDSVQIASANNIVRLLFLIPTAYLFAYFYKEKNSAKPAIPWLLFLFFIPVLIRNYAPSIIQPSFFESFVNLAKAGFTITIFLTGIGFSRQTFKNIGIKPLIFGFLLWILLAIVSLFWVIRLV